jgi:hypothetical protein
MKLFEVGSDDFHFLIHKYFLCLLSKAKNAEEHTKNENYLHNSPEDDCQPFLRISDWNLEA